MSDSRVSPYSLNDVKNTTDDALGNYLRGLNFKQDNTKLDFRLTVGYMAVVIAAALFAADYKLGWDATKQYTPLAVGAYAVLNGVLTYWIWIVENGLVFEGTRNGKSISIASKTKKCDPTYYLTITTSSDSSTRSTREIQTSFTKWFTSDGYFEPKPLQRWLASSIDIIGEADPKNQKSKIVDIDVDPEAVVVTGAEAGSSKASKRGKKKT